jgi:mannose-6-phosphate isomerase-like protein (cupin superfamily)
VLPAAVALMLRSVAPLAAVMVAIGAALGAVDVSAPAFATQHGQPGLARVLVAASSFGSLLGGLAYGARSWNAPATHHETGGELVQVETLVRPGGFVAAQHVHPHQTERFEVREGELGLRVGDRELPARPGDVATVRPGTPHRFWNAGEGETRFLCEVRPALEFESLIETMFTLAAEGKTNRKGMPNPLRLAVIARSHFDTVRVPFPPVWLQRAALAIRTRSRSPSHMRTRLTCVLTVDSSITSASAISLL